MERKVVEEFNLSDGRQVKIYEGIGEDLLTAMEIAQAQENPSMSNIITNLMEILSFFKNDIVRAEKSWVVAMLKNNISFTEIRKSSLPQLSFLLNLLIEYVKEEEREILSRLKETEEGYL